jgi:hypothetical protein
MRKYLCYKELFYHEEVVSYSANSFESCINLWTSSKASLLHKRHIKSEAFYRICNRQKKCPLCPLPRCYFILHLSPIFENTPSCFTLFASPLGSIIRHLYISTFYISTFLGSTFLLSALLEGIVFTSWASLFFYSVTRVREIVMISDNDHIDQ